MNELIPLSSLQVAAAAALVVVNGVISIALRLGLARTLAIASVRTIAQLALIGLVLEAVFAIERWYAVIAILAVMTAIAGVTAGQRTRHRYPGIWLNTIVSVWASSWVVTAFALAVILHGSENWYRPQYAIPLLGMVLGNTLNGISLGLGTLLETLTTERDRVEASLALGATRWEAARDPVRRALRTGTTPIINSMMVVGLVSLPGMMTGQILAGAPPAEAVKYQIVIMFLVASGTALGTVGVVILSYRRLFTREHRFRRELIRTRR